MHDLKQYFDKILHQKAFKFSITFILICFPIMATLSDYGTTLDEPIYQEAAWSIKKWLSLGPEKIFDRHEIDSFWKTDPARNVHPSGVKWLYLIAQKTIFWENDPYRQNAVLNVLIFCISMTFFLTWWADFRLSRCVIFLIVLLSMPRFFAHTHFPATDMPMISFLLLLVVSMDKALFRNYFWLTGILLGFFLSIKITSLLLALPVFMVLFFCHRNDPLKILIRFIIICLAGLFTFYLLNPDYWFSPISRINEFIMQSVTRRSWTPFKVFFNGEFYKYRGPFYYPFTMFFITTPILHILLLFTGLFYFSTNRESRNNHKMILICACLIFPFFILTLPISPAHDGIRYLLPAFPFAACFMTIGLEKTWYFIRERRFNLTVLKRIFQWVVAAALTFILAMDLRSPARYPPFELSYYNRIIGGVSGAFRHGYETTYWWEILNDDILALLNTKCAGSLIYFPLLPTDYYFDHLINIKRVDFIPTVNIKDAQYMLIIGRPNVNFWEFYTRPKFKNIGKMPNKIWDISLDSVPLLQLYSIQNIIR